MEFPSFDWYEFDENKIFLRHEDSGNWGGFSWNAAWVEIKEYLSRDGKTFEEETSFRDGPLENLWGGGRAKYKKNIRAREN